MAQVTAILFSGCRTCGSAKLHLLFLKDHEAVPHWYELAGNMWIVTFDVLVAAVGSIFAGLFTMILLCAWCSPIIALIAVFGSKRVNDAAGKVLRWICLISIIIIFVLAVAWIMYSSKNLLHTTLDPMFMFLPRWLGILIGGLILVPCYILLFKISRLWLRETFGSGSNDVKDALE